MVRFDIEFGEAFILQDNIEENGWIFTYDSVKQKFLLWSNVENQVSGWKPEQELDTLEEVLAKVNSYT